MSTTQINAINNSSQQSALSDAYRESKRDAETQTGRLDSSHSLLSSTNRNIRTFFWSNQTLIHVDDLLKLSCLSWHFVGRQNFGATACSWRRPQQQQQQYMEYWCRQGMDTCVRTCSYSGQSTPVSTAQINAINNSSQQGALSDAYRESMRDAETHRQADWTAHTHCCTEHRQTSARAKRDILLQERK